MDADAGAAPLREGDALTGRYRLERRTGGSAPVQGPAPTGSTSTWHGRDLVLRRPVELLAVAGGGEDVVDAARRAALVEDPRVLRVLDVGSTGDAGRAGWSFVVMESVAGESLAALVERRGPLPAALVRTLVGEAAQALERARSSGLHHRRLSPEHLLQARDGGVVVTGVEILAAAADGDPAEVGGRTRDEQPGGPAGPRRTSSGDVDPAVAARADAVALVSLLYAGLTGRWPDPSGGEHAGAVPGREGGPAGLPPAPRGGAGPVPPGDLVREVPADLDVLCSVVLGPHEDGPRTPGELADELAPWESPYLDGRPGGGRGAPVAATAGTASVPAARRPGAPASAGAHAADEAGPSDAGREPPGAERVPSDGDRDPGAGSDQDAEPLPVGAGALAGVPTAGDQTSSVPVAAAVAAAPVRAARPALRPRGAAIPAAPDEPGAPTPPATDEVRTTTGTRGPGAGGGGGALAAEPARRPSRAQAAVVIAIALAAVVVALVLALGVLGGIGSGGAGADEDAEGAAPAPGATTEPSPAATSTPTPSTTPSATGPVPLVSEGAAVDPGGDGEENDDEVPDALDGDAGTAWSSSTYTSSDFGNLKTGLGYAVELVQPALVSGVTLTTGGDGGTVELRSAQGPTFDGSEVLATADLDGGEVDIALEEPVRTQDLLLWFTSLPEVDDGYAVQLSQVQVR